MNILLSVLAIIVSILAIFINQWISFFPHLGIRFQYYRRRVQIGIAAVTILSVLGLYLNNPTLGQLIVLLAVILLTTLSGFHHAGRLIFAVDWPKQVQASAAAWRKDDMVLGYAAEEQVACAWLVDTLIPHHLVNDTVQGEPVLAGW